ncbi:MAG: hypothetical protein U1E53_04280 [Dongiaceae bacterium]
MQSMTEMGHPLIKGYVVVFEVTRILDPTDFRLDVRIVLSKDWEPSSSVTTIRLTGVRDLSFGTPISRIDFGALLMISISDVSADQWDRVRFKVENIEDDFPLSLYCRAVEVASDTVP